MNETHYIAYHVCEHSYTKACIVITEEKKYD